MRVLDRVIRKSLLCGAALFGLGALAGAQVSDGSFESGGFGSWVVTDHPIRFIPIMVGGAGFTNGFGAFTTAPTDGVFSAQHGFDGGSAGTITLAQDVLIDGDLLLFDYRAGWDLMSFGATIDRTFRVDIEPAGGGAAAQSTTLLTATAGTIVGDTGVVAGSVDVSAFVGSTMRVSFEWDVPETSTGPALFELDNVRTAGSPATCALFGTDAAGGNLLLIDPSTGAGTVVGNMGVGPVPSLAMHPTTNVLYAGGGGGLPLIYTVDPTTGAATLLGDSGLVLAAIGALEFAPDGTLYASVNIASNGGSGGDHLATIDTTTGLATVIGPYDGGCSPPAACALDGIEAIAFDSQGTLWGVLREQASTGTSGLYTIDTATGLATFQRPIVDRMGIPLAGGIVSLECCGSVFYGGTATPDGGTLVTIDRFTGVFTQVSGLSATPFDTSLGGLARGLVTSSSVVRNGTGVNPVGYVEVTPALLGSTHDTTVDIVTPSAMMSIVAVTTAGPTTVSTGFGELLIDLSIPPYMIDVAMGAHSILVPNDTCLLGLPVYTQGATFSPGDLRFNNAIDVVLGNQ